MKRSRKRAWRLNPLTGKRELDKRTPYRKALDELEHQRQGRKRAEKLSDELVAELDRERARYAELEAKIDQIMRDEAEARAAIMASNQRLCAKLHSRTAALARARGMIAELIDEQQLPR